MTKNTNPADAANLWAIAHGAAEALEDAIARRNRKAKADVAAHGFAYAKRAFREAAIEIARLDIAYNRAWAAAVTADPTCEHA